MVGIWCVRLCYGSCGLKLWCGWCVVRLGFCLVVCLVVVDCCDDWVVM